MKLVGNRYETIEQLGSGAAGAVYKARDPVKKKIVTVKLLTRHSISERAAIRFQREAKAQSGLSHENLSSVLDFGIDTDGTPYMVTTFIEGRSLKEVIAIKGPFPPDLAVKLLKQVASCMDYVHGKGIIHRDIKSENIVLEEREQDYRAVVVDFGVAKLAEENEGSHLTKAGQIVGSPYYISPEQAAGLDIDRRSDVYSLGCVAFEMLTGSVPYQGDNALETIRLHATAPVPSLQEMMVQDVPGQLDETVRKMLEKDPKARLDSMSELLGCLETIESEIAKGYQSDQELPIMAGAGGRRKPRTGIFLIAIAILLVLGLSVSGYLLFKSPAQESDKPIETAVEAAVPPSKSALSEDITQLISDNDFIRSREGGLLKVRANNLKNELDWSHLNTIKEPFLLSVWEADLSPDLMKRILKTPSIKGLVLGDHKKPLTIEYYEIISKRRDLRIMHLIKVKKLTAEALERISRIEALNTLTVSNCKVDQAMVDQICKMKGMRRLAFRENPAITSAFVAQICGSLPGLADLDLEDTSVDDGAMDAVASLKDLANLNLNGTGVTDRGITRLKNRHLSIVCLERTKVSDRGLLSLARIPSMRKVLVDNQTPVTTAGIKRACLNNPSMNVISLE
ncbi:MAG: protein kinase [Candidatus Obscuribacterales bacterium]